MPVKVTQQALERAIGNDELVLYYQPKLSLLSGEPTGAEALVRWDDPEREIISPDQFLPLAEKTGLLHDMTVHLLAQVVNACQAVRSDRAGLAISINVAPNDLASQAISANIGDYLSRGEIQADELQIEITENAAMSNVHRVHDDLVALRSLGIHILMDDFGTGYSSIDRLSQLPFNALKLDQGVVKRMSSSHQNLSVVKSAISMARELRMTSVAEGIESAETYDMLIATGCEEAQGYYIARPMSLHDFQAWLANPPELGGSHIGRVHQAVYNLVHYRKCLIDAVWATRNHQGQSVPVMLDPDVQSPLAGTRLGLWYFGAGQSLAGLTAFDALARPMDELHQCGHRFLEELGRGLERSALHRWLLDIDARVNALIGLLHHLERKLLCLSDAASET